MRRALPLVVVVALLGAACTSGGAGPDGVPVADGWSIEVVRDDLQRPTQLVEGNDETTLYVAELAGGERAGEGRVRALGDGGRGEAEEVLEDLLTPTGLAILAEEGLFLQERETLSIAHPDGVAMGDQVGDGFEVLTEGLPFNGRSQGTLTLVDHDGRARLLATATGSGTGPEVPEGSGRLYSPAFRGMAAETVAVGFKNAYAHALDADGNLYVTEVGDGTYDGEAPPDELNVIPEEVWRRALDGGTPYDGGWPRCTGDGDPTEEFGVTADDCMALPRPLAAFPPRSTPTSVAVTTEGRVLVALWVDGRVVEVAPDDGIVTDVVTGMDGPQHLLARPDGTVLLTVHGSGELWRLRPPG